MNTDRDSYDDIEDDRGAVATSGSGGAILGVLMTLVIGCGLVFAAYKLGQRTSVDDPPLLRADAQEAKMVPLDEGGTPIANQDNDAYAMVDQARRDRVPSGEVDGVLVTDQLPARELDPASTLAVTAAQQDALRIDELQPAPSLSGQPSLTDNAAPDRTAELQLSGGAGVTQATEDAVLRANTIDPNAATTGNASVSAGGTPQVAGLNVPSATGLPSTTGLSGNANAPTTGLQLPNVSVPPLVRAPDTAIVVAPAITPGPLTEDSFGDGIVAPMPRIKPDLGPSITSAGRSALTQPRTGPLAPAAAVATTIIPSQPAGAGLVAPAGLPPQPRGDAQVQLGAMPSPDQVRGRWRELQSQHSDLLGRLGLQVLPVRTAQGAELHRLRVGPLPTTQSAAQLCAQLRGRGVDCFVPTRR